jgi:hypothetical protein
MVDPIPFKLHGISHFPASQLEGLHWLALASSPTSARRVSRCKLVQFSAADVHLEVPLPGLSLPPTRPSSKISRCSPLGPPPSAGGQGLGCVNRCLSSPTVPHNCSDSRPSFPLQILQLTDIDVHAKGTTLYCMLSTYSTPFLSCFLNAWW